MAGDLAHYRAWLLRQPCACAPCVAPVEIHHHTSAPTFAPGEKPPKVIDAKRGKGQRSSDFYGLPLCPRHHTGELHRLKGYFAGWSGEQIRAWQDEQVERLRALYEAWVEQHPEPAMPSAQRRGRTAPTTGDPLTAARIAGRTEERRGIVELLRDLMGKRHVNADQVAILDEVRALVEARRTG